MLCCKCYLFLGTLIENRQVIVNKSMPVMSNTLPTESGVAIQDENYREVPIM